ncbi:hypothetical protein SDRG_07051 [Saprolegnia diclina VS20]|uniref:Uncharacterized protein n=1 Tax=Saprolegnia diclina (strain VS20) TaxID=1156394 RepID=T0QBQ3_SAPDV|nr:hypothetical protein SDRG_07051 [Saprolegnia diclina VS20]EQC35339.1 hypothetical protein SDRG_07051 [Saprolegnia diclina VS20]|eukprot:XP_008611089.1 hypothetical protein SDRG_07051 [Saprolegnia diclina VS20]
MSKLPCAVPMAIVQPGVLRYIVQCLTSTRDVLSLLQALPRDALDASLAALWTLLSTPSEYEAKHWPQICIEDINGRYAPTVLAALPVFRSIRINNLGDLDYVLQAASSNVDDAPLASAILLAAKWGHKIAICTVDRRLDGYCLDDLINFFGLCTGLDEILVHPDELDQAFLAAVLHAAQHATRLEFSSTKASGLECGDWRPLLAAWLASGHATHLGLEAISFDDNEGLAYAIAAAPSLDSLSLAYASSVLRSFVHEAVPLPHLTQLQLHLDDNDGDDVFAETLLREGIDVSALCVLSLEADFEWDGTFVLELLPDLLALQELSLTGCSLQSMPPLHVPRHLKLLELQECDMDDDVCLELLAWASQAPCLTTLRLVTISTPRTNPDRFGRFLRQWIRKGVGRIEIVHCDLNEKSGFAIASALGNTHRSSNHFVLKLDGDNLSLQVYYSLLEALATLTDADGVVQGVVKAVVPLQCVTELRLTLPEDDDIYPEPLMPNVMDLSALRILELPSPCYWDCTFLLAPLPRLVALEELFPPRPPFLPRAAASGLASRQSRGVLVHIAHGLSSARDVPALLKALPLEACTAPLAAL